MSTSHFGHRGGPILPCCCGSAAGSSGVPLCGRQGVLRDMPENSPVVSTTDRKGKWFEGLEALSDPA